MDRINCHKDFPQAAEMFKIDVEMLSQYQLELGSKTSQIPETPKTLQSKQNDVCYYSVLKFSCQEELQVTKLHKALNFNRSDSMKCYIEENTKLQQKTVMSTIEKTFFKLLNNSCF